MPVIVNDGPLLDKGSVAEKQRQLSERIRLAAEETRHRILSSALLVRERPLGQARFKACDAEFKIDGTVLEQMNGTVLVESASSATALLRYTFTHAGCLLRLTHFNIVF